MQNFVLHLMSLLTVPTVKNSYILAGTYFIFQKNVLDEILESCKTKFGSQRKDQKSRFQVRQTSALFSDLVALILG